MIRVHRSGKLITIRGHANYNEHGKDIVCASVSSIIYTTVNGILSFNSDVIEFIDNDIMSITIFEETTEVKILINNMFNLLCELEKQYPKNIKICKGD